MVKRVPNPYQVTYEDGLVWRTIHVNHAKPAKTPVAGFPAPIPTPEPPRPTLGYLPRSLQRPLSRRQPPPPQSAAPAEGSPAPAAASPAATPPSSQRSALAAANRYSAPRAAPPPPPAPGTANENSRPGQQLRCSARLTPKGRMHWIPDPTPPPPHRTGMDYSDPLVQTSDSPVSIPSDSVRRSNAPVKTPKTSDTQASTIATSASSGAPLTSPIPSKCRRRRRRKAHLAANENSAPRSAAPVTPDERWANHNAGIPRATQHQPEASDPTQMKRTTVYQDPSIHPHSFTQPPISAANRNSAFTFGQERRGIPGLYKPALPDLRQDLTAGTFGVNNSGSSLSSPSHLHPYTKPFSGWPARPLMTCPTREAGGALRERPGIVYPLLPSTQHPDTSIAIEAALPEAAAVGRQALPPTVVDIGTTSQPPPAPPTRRRASRKPSRKRRRNRSTGVFRPPKCLPLQEHWCN